MVIRVHTHTTLRELLRVQYLDLERVPVWVTLAILFGGAKGAIQITLLWDRSLIVTWGVGKLEGRGSLF